MDTIDQIFIIAIFSCVTIMAGIAMCYSVYCVYQLRDKYK